MSQRGDFKLRKIILNQEVEILIVGLWLMVLFPMAIPIYKGLYWFFIVGVLWCVLFVVAYKLLIGTISIYEDKFIINILKKEYVVKFNDIRYILAKERRRGFFVYKIVLLEQKNDTHRILLKIVSPRFCEEFNKQNEKILVIKDESFK
jgi:hypothetical protein